MVNKDDVLTMGHSVYSAVLLSCYYSVCMGSLPTFDPAILIILQVF
jgi:hypothetical protein